MMKFIGGVILALITTQALAQTQQVFYLRSDGARVDSVADADYIRVVKAPDSGSVLLLPNHLPSIRLLSMGRRLLIIPTASANRL